LRKTQVEKKTQVLAIFGEIQPIFFCKTQVKFSKKSSDLLNRDSRKTQVKNPKTQVSGFSQVALSQKSGQKKSLTYGVLDCVTQSLMTIIYEFIVTLLRIDPLFQGG